tara:strand:- start:6380 stop:7252 length:873 start_codon:yes stop_codon:yes gene_type:complete
MKLLILGANGLVGNTIAKYFFERTAYQTIAIIRDYSKIKLFNEKYQQNFSVINNILDFDETKKKLQCLRPDILINCLGITNKQNLVNSNQIENIININSVLPHRLQRICSDLDARLIHLSTDCIFSGSRGLYSEYDIPDPTDIYGRSKLLGELDLENTLTIRKSVIGHELVSKKGLLEWFLNQNRSVQGYKNVIFSGLTVLELAKVIDKYIFPRSDLKGILNISGESISKFDLLKIISDIYNKSIEIIPNQSIKINRTLNSSQFNKLTGYRPNKWPELIKSMYEFNLFNK